MSEETRELLVRLSDSWPVSYRLKFDGGEIANIGSHVLGAEILGAIENQKCCLPFFLPNGNEIAWFNIARDVDDLQATIQSLRCWFIPSYGWEDERGWIVTQEGGSTELAKQILNASPAGYCRWRSKTSDFDRIAKKLSKIRWLENAQPELPPNGPPPLLQIRQQFVTALVAGDKHSAEAAIRLIESHQLDTADNTLFMRVRLWFTFNEFERIVQHKDVARLTQLRIPKIVRLCLLRAFYAASFRNLDWDADTEAAVAAYELNIHGLVGGLIRESDDDETEDIRRLRACYAIVTSDRDLAAQLLPALTDTGLVQRLNSVLATSGTVEGVSLEDAFLAARVQKDWRRVQELGAKLLETHPEIYAPLLKQSLSFRSDDALETQLAAILSASTAKADESVDAAEEGKHHPDSWPTWLNALANKADLDYLKFLRERPESSVDHFSPDVLVSIATDLEEIFLSTQFKSDQTTVQLLLTGLPEMMQDFVNEPKFPRDTLVPIYANLFRIWAALKCGSLHPPDSQVLLSLADGILSFDRDLEKEVVTQFEAWWNKSPAKSLLPFLLGVVELLDSKGTEEQCSNFWITGATFLKTNPQYLTVGERALWRQIGSQFLDADTIDEYLPLPQGVDAPEDPLHAAGLGKVAIVSMREPQARAAAAMITQRSEADVVLVTQKAAGAQTDSAITADVVLFVWRSTSHAVFRAFDDMDKRKLAYVQGTGSGSIVLALERWIADRD